VRVAEDLVRKGYVGRTIGIKLRYDDFRTVTRDLTLDEATADAIEIRRAATECLRRVQLNRKLRLLGVRISALMPASAQALKPRVPVQADLPFASGE
jgi:DNA polymerase-4